MLNSITKLASTVNKEVASDSVLSKRQCGLLTSYYFSLQARRQASHDLKAMTELDQRFLLPYLLSP